MAEGLLHDAEHEDGPPGQKGAPPAKDKTKNTHLAQAAVLVGIVTAAIAWLSYRRQRTASSSGTGTGTTGAYTYPSGMTGAGDVAGTTAGAGSTSSPDLTGFIQQQNGVNEQLLADLGMLSGTGPQQTTGQYPLGPGSGQPPINITVNVPPYPTSAPHPATQPAKHTAPPAHHPHPAQPKPVAHHPATPPKHHTVTSKKAPPKKKPPAKKPPAPRRA